ncbi:MAG: hypothetical protein DDT28_00758 [Dehalococcoidia bacterium]|nr:hypothetical protein [Chloroflexota bacterium]
MGRGLVGDYVGGDSPACKLRQHLGSIAQESDRERPPLAPGLLGQSQGLIQIIGHSIEILSIQAAPDPFFIYLNNYPHPTIHGYGQGLSPTHPP